MVDLKLQSIARMPLPDAGHFNFFSFSHRKNRPDDCHTRAVIEVKSSHRVMGIGVLVSNPADNTLKR